MGRLLLAILLVACDATTGSRSADVPDPGRGDSWLVDARPVDAHADAEPARDAASFDASEAPDAAPPDVQPDAGDPDAATPDGAVGDASAPDGRRPDAELPDARADGPEPDAQPFDVGPELDGPLPDLPEPDAAPPDGPLPDLPEPDAAPPDGPLPDLPEPDAAPPPPAPPAVQISEVVAANDDGLVDDLGDHVDWLELVNRELFAVDLDGWFLSDDPDDPTRWRLPAVVLPPAGRLLVYASERDLRDPDGPLHTNFRIDSGGEPLLLVFRDGETVVDRVDLPRLPDDVSHGVREEVARIPLVDAETPLRWRVPEAEDPEGWAAADFDDGGWGAAAGGLGYVALPPRPDVEVAAGRPATQTSTLGGFVAANGVNGNFDDFTHTSRDDQSPAWEVDLGDDLLVRRVVLHNRRGCCQSRLRDVEVEVLGGDRAVRYTSPLLNPENVLGGGTLAGPARLEVEPAATGRYVRVTRAPDLDLSGTGGQGNDDEPTVLSLGEVEVFAADPGADAFVDTDLQVLMQGRNASLRVRAPFTVEDPAQLDRLVLRVLHDDGFAVFLNGAPVGAVRAPEALTWDATATGAGPEPLQTAELDLSQHIGLLRPGRNVLAVQGLNEAADDDDFLLRVSLEAFDVTPGEGRVFLLEPSPGAPNGGPFVEGFVAPVEPSAPHGFRDAPFELTLATETDGATIHYTRDGSRPDAGSPVYDGPIPIEDSTVVRALATRDGWVESPVLTATWVFPARVADQSHDAVLARGFPETWGGTAPDYAVDPALMSVDSLLAVPSLALATEAEGLFGPDGIYTNSQQHGVAWERATSLELLDPAGEEDLQVDCGLRIQGGAFRSHGLTKKHSLRVLFKRAYGPGTLRHPLVGPDGPDRFETVTFRANSNDGWQWAGAGPKPLYVRDRFGRETMLAMGGVASHARFFHLYVNAVYWGLYEAVERPDAASASTWLGGDRGDWDGLNSGSPVDGDAVAWSALLGMARGGLATLADWYAVRGFGPDGARDPALPAWVDAENLADYMLTNLYVGNTDWPQKNYYVGRPRSGRLGFHFFMWDSEWSLGLRSDLNTNRVGVDFGVAEPWAALRQNPEFRVLVGDRAHRHLVLPGGALYVDPDAPEWDPEHPDRNVPAARFAALAERVRAALVAESARWGDQHRDPAYTVDDWAAERANLLANYFPLRSAVFLGQLRAAGLYPDVAAPTLRRGEEGDELVAPDGVVFYTIDGPDPRRPGGDVHPDALGGEAEARLPVAGRLRARANVAGAWSALLEVDLLP